MVPPEFAAGWLGAGILCQMVDLHEGSTIFRENSEFRENPGGKRVRIGTLWSPAARKCGLQLVYLELRRGAHRKKMQTALELHQRFLTPKREPA
jgi:hypothetical protein